MNFQQTRFLVSAARFSQCPPDEGIEVAFAGRSNAGKSSTLNVLTGQRNLARTSKTPGRTQLLNFFTVEDGVRLVDLPGFGFAKVPEKVRQAWHRELDAYFRDRQSLAGLVLVSDIRHAPNEFEGQLLDWCAEVTLPVIVLLNKADKLSRNQVAQATMKRRRQLADSGTESVVIAVSALNRQGFDAFRARLAWLLRTGSLAEKNPGSSGE